MKHRTLMAGLFALAGLAWPVLAQDDGQLIPLDDANPTVEVAISLPRDTTGAVGLDLIDAGVTLLDAAGTPVLRAADPRLHGLEFNVVPNSGPHTLTVERLPGTATAYVRVHALPELTRRGTTTAVSAGALTLHEEVTLDLTGNSPMPSIQLRIPASETGVVTAVFSDTHAVTRVADAAQRLLAEAHTDHVDGLNLMLESGEYQLALDSASNSAGGRASVRAVPAAEIGYTVLQASTGADALAAQAVPCSALVTVASTNLRSGPGTGYSILDHGVRDQQLTVGGQNVETNWVLVETSMGAAWAARENLQLQGDCTTLTTYSIPLLDAAPMVLSVASGRADDDDDEHEEDDHDEHEGYEHDDEHDDD